MDVLSASTDVDTFYLTVCFLNSYFALHLRRHAIEQAVDPVRGNSRPLARRMRVVPFPCSRRSVGGSTGGAVKCHPHARTWSQGNLGLRLHHLAGCQIQPVALHHHADDQRCLHQRGVAGDADEAVISQAPSRRWRRYYPESNKRCGCGTVHDRSSLTSTPRSSPSQAQSVMSTGRLSCCPNARDARLPRSSSRCLHTCVDTTSL